MDMLFDFGKCHYKVAFMEPQLNIKGCTFMKLEALGPG